MHLYNAYIFLPGESHGQRSLVGCCLLDHTELDTGHDWSDLAAAAIKKVSLNFPGGPVVKDPPANAGNMNSILGPGWSHKWWRVAIKPMHHNHWAHTTEPVLHNKGSHSEKPAHSHKAQLSLALATTRESLRATVKTQCSQTNTVYQHIYMEFRKMVMTTLYARQQKRHRSKEQTFGLCGRGWGWDDLGEWHWNMYTIM